MASTEQEEEENVAELKLGKVFQDAQVITIPEVETLLQSMITNKKSAEPGYQPPAMVAKTLDYVRRFSMFRSRESQNQLREVLLHSNNLHEFEFGLVANLGPETAEEAKTLIPSLATNNERTEEELQAILDEVGTYKQFE